MWTLLLTPFGAATARFGVTLALALIASAIGQGATGDGLRHDRDARCGLVGRVVSQLSRSISDLSWQCQHRLTRFWLTMMLQCHSLEKPVRKKTGQDTDIWSRHGYG